MKIFNNVLTENLLSDIRMDISEAHDEEAWKSSFAWRYGLTTGFFSNCLSRTIEGEMKEKILKEIKPLIPECNVYYLQYYIWQQLSGIAVHDDEDKIFGATIYLNERWEPENGGIFLYKDKKNSGQEWNALLPERNNMVLNDEHELHMVTAVSPYSTDLRYTIQIWGQDKDYDEYED
jgi:hypothetical protein|tara:strand:+ start:117 stop:647 length:531 start_codon:yes stop_codon:yes gene_type:complete